MRRIICFLLLVAVCVPMAAQKRRGGKSARLTREQRLENIDSLLRTYRFSEVIPLIEQEISTAEKNKMSTDTLERQLLSARLGERMLENTEEVQFVDSFLCLKNEVLKYVRPSSDAGSLSMAGGQGVEGLAYTNTFGDRRFAAEAADSGSVRLVEQNMIGKEWSRPVPLEGLEERENVRMVAPFLMSDGTSLYFAEEGEESLGGLDIFVTRMGPQRSYLKPENIGMPFNSPANDYLYVVDEDLGLGWFVTDRRQRGDTVCVYVFIPNATRRTYAGDTIYDEAQIRQLAQIMDITSSQVDAQHVAQVRSVLQTALQQGGDDRQGGGFKFYVGNGKVITDIQGFSNSEAMQTAVEWDSAMREYTQLQRKLQNYRAQWHAGDHSASLQKTILASEGQMDVLRSRISELANTIRREETSTN